MDVPRAITRSLVCGLLALPLAAVSTAGTDKPEYRETTVQKLKATPEKYRNRKVTYTGRFVGFTTTFFPYMEASGFKADRAYGLIVGHASVPVIAPKDAEFKALMSEIKPGVNVRVRGRLKRFSKKPANTLLPRHYVSLIELEVLKTPSLLDLIRAKRSRSEEGDGQPTAE